MNPPTRKSAAVPVKNLVALKKAKTTAASDPPVDGPGRPITSGEVERKKALVKKVLFNFRVSLHIIFILLILNRFHLELLRPLQRSNKN